MSVLNASQGGRVGLFCIFLKIFSYKIVFLQFEGSGYMIGDWLWICLFKRILNKQWVHYFACYSLGALFKLYIVNYKL